MGATLESTFEKRLIEQLTRGISQWTYRQDLKTEKDLWRNFRQKIEQNNVGCKLIPETTFKRGYNE